jgi:hypothetical protein
MKIAYLAAAAALALLSSPAVAAIADPGWSGDYDMTGRYIDRKYTVARSAVVSYCAQIKGHLVDGGSLCMKIAYWTARPGRDWCIGTFADDLQGDRQKAAWKYANAYCQLWYPLD